MSPRFCADEEAATRAAQAVGGAARRQRRVLLHTGSDFGAAVEFVARAVGTAYPGWVDGLGRRAVPQEPAGPTAGGHLDPALIERFYGVGTPYWSD